MARLIGQPQTRPPYRPTKKGRILLPEPVINLVNNPTGALNGTNVNITDTTSGDHWDVATPGTGGTLQWDAGSILIATGVTSTTSYVAWTTQLGTVRQLWFRAYLTIPAAPPTVTQMVARGLGATAQKFRLTVESTGKLILRDQANTSLVTSTSNIPATKIRVEGFVTAGSAGPFEIRYWTNPDSAGTPTETLTGTGDFLTTDFDEIRFGVGASFASVVGYHLGGFGVSTVTWLGPLPASTPGVLIPGAQLPPVAWGLAATGAQLFAAPQAQAAAPTAAGVQPLVPLYSSYPPWPATPTVRLFATSAPAVVVAATATPQPLVVTPGPVPQVMPPAQPPAGAFLTPNSSTTASAQPYVVTPPPVPPVLPPATYLSASQPLGNPAVGSPDPLVITPPTPPVLVPPVFMSASLPLGNPAQPTPQALVVAPPPAPPLLPRPFLAAGSPTTTSGQPLVVTPPWQPVPIPLPQISASQPLGNPAVGTVGPYVVTQPWTSKVPGALVFGPGAPTAAIVTGSTPGPLVVSPPFAVVPVPQVYISASLPLGNPAVGSPQPYIPATPQPAIRPPTAIITANQAAAIVTTATGIQPLVVGPTFTLAPVPGARVLSAPATAQVATTPGPLLVTPPWQHIRIPRPAITWSQPLGNPAVATPQPQITTPAHRWTPPTPALLIWTRDSTSAPAPTPVLVGIDGSASGQGYDGSAQAPTYDMAATASGATGGHAQGQALDGGTSSSGNLG